MILLSKQAQAESEQIAQEAQVTELSDSPVFMEKYMDYMCLRRHVKEEYTMNMKQWIAELRAAEVKSQCRFCRFRPSSYWG